MFGEGAEGEELEVTLNGQRVKLFKLDEVPMFFMRESKGSHPAKPQPTDPIEERVKMTPDIRLEFTLKVKAGPQTLGVAFLNKAQAINEDLVRRPVSSTYDVFIGMQYGYTTAPHLSRVVITGPYNPTGLGDTPSRRRVFTCKPASPGDEAACAKQIVSALVRRAYRRAPVEADLEPLLALYQEERNKTGNFEAGIEMALRRILADPEFIFRFEPPPAGVAAKTAYRISDTELASRLSFFLWSSIPDEELLKLAIDGKLRQPAVLERQARRMLADPKSRSLVTNFANQWLFLRELKNANPDVTIFPDFDDNLRQAFQRETELLFESVIREDRSVLDLLDSDYTFVNERLARHYGIPNIYGPDFRRVPVPSDARRGLLGHGSLQLVTSNPNRTSPVMRGKWILENLIGTAAPTAAARRATARREADRDREVGARAHRAAPRQPGVRRLPQDHGPHRAGHGELRRRRPLADDRRRRRNRCVGTARRRHRAERTGEPAQGDARSPGRVHRGADREADDVRRRTRDEVLRHARGAQRDARRGEEPVSFLGSDPRRRQERAVSNESEIVINVMQDAKCKMQRNARRDLN